jgi:hypothetical protein
MVQRYIFFQFLLCLPRSLRDRILELCYRLSQPYYHHAFGKTKTPTGIVGVLNIIQIVLAMPLQSPNGVCMPPPIFIYDLVHCGTKMRENNFINKFFLNGPFLP